MCNFEQNSLIKFIELYINIVNYIVVTDLY